MKNKMNSADIKTIEDTFTADTYARYDAVLVQGLGVRAKDPEGREYIDFTSGIGVNSLGFCEPGWVKAVKEQTEKLQHVSNLFYSEPCALAAEKLVSLTGMSSVFFSNSGAEANEGAIKAARKYSYMKYGQETTGDSGRYRILTLEGSFHGRTMATITATGQSAFHKYFTPFLQGFDYASINDIDSLSETVTDKTCAIMIEFIQGEGGVIELEMGFVSEIAALCEERDILLIADEVQTGIGRTGKFMAYDHFGVKPDIVTVAKGVGGGLPIGGVIFGDKAKDALGPGDHGSTFGGNPVVCAGAEYVLSKFMDGGSFLKEIAEKGDYFRERLKLIPGVKDVSGLGLMIGIDIFDKDAKAVCTEALSRGLLLLTAKNKIRLLPPLNIERNDIDEGLMILADAIASV
jgi:acetylornithine/N-succinyldiaminopimelate aminotransferase